MHMPADIPGARAHLRALADGNSQRHSLHTAGRRDGRCAKDI